MMRQDMFPLFEALQEKFGGQVQSMETVRENETYLFVGDTDIQPITQYLRGEFGARLVTVFAEDQRQSEGVFFIYYVFEEKGGPRFLILRAPVPADDPHFPSLS